SWVGLGGAQKVSAPSGARARGYHIDLWRSDEIGRSMKSNIRKVETTCNTCGSTNTEIVTTGSEHEYDNTTDDVFTVVRCTDCGLVYLNPRPDLSELETIYPPNYYAYKIEE